MVSSLEVVVRYEQFIALQNGYRLILESRNLGVRQFISTDHCFIKDIGVKILHNNTGQKLDKIEALEIIKSLKMNSNI